MEERKIITWFKRNWVLISILVFTLVIRIYYFIILNGQVLWWDEAEYMNMARQFAFGTNYSFGPVRPILFSAITAIFFKISNTELLPRLLILFLSLASVFGMYLFGKELYNKKVGLVASFLMSIFYLNIFYTYRLLVDMPSLTFFIFSGFFFYKYFKTKSPKFIYLTAVMLAIGTLFKLSTAFIVPAILIFVLITEGFKFFKKKEVWIAILIFILILSPYIIWGYSEFGGFIFTEASSHSTPENYLVGFSLMKDYINLFPTYFSWPLLVIFIFGIIMMYKVFLYFDRLIKGDNKLRRDLFLLLILLIPFILISFLLNHVENRYIITVFPTIFLISSSFIMFGYNFIKRKSKLLAVILLIGLLVFISVFQIIKTDVLVKNKQYTYSGIRDAGLWLKNNSNVSDIIATRSWPQISYYSERETIKLYENEEEFESMLSENNKFFMLSAFEYHPEWAYTYPQRNNLTTVQAYLDKENQPIIVIYKLK